MPSTDRPFSARLEAGWERATEHLPLAAVPVISSLASVDEVRRVLEFRDGAHFGLAFRFPPALADVWTFVSLPNREPGVHVSPTLALLPVVILVESVLLAGLLGSVREALETGRYDFGENARRYFAPVLVYQALVAVVGFAAFAVMAAVLPLAVVLIPAFIALSYLFYAAPYLLVVADAGVEDALVRSYEWAVAGGPYLRFGVGYLLVVTAVSLVGTAVVVNLGALGVLVGAFASAPVALALTFATAEFVAEMDREGMGTAGTDAGR
ncbi:hypothetical protein NGM10_03665 [Halorussus salilacus]|uniref:hypothetical protein n=1 Tax=Halorussus salilacus TaxID=2953750 RepID=UPI0020A1EA6B|nr:hypothetical protein [Halorussus salilacus]USZ68839.1 hypothetical protein NGM10_03665 [Halorussus salilacus]